MARLKASSLLVWCGGSGHKVGVCASQLPVEFASSVVSCRYLSNTDSGLRIVPSWLTFWTSAMQPRVAGHGGAEVSSKDRFGFLVAFPQLLRARPEVSPKQSNPAAEPWAECLDGG